MGDTTARRTSTVLAAATLGIYVLLMAGATTAITDASAACTTWPICKGELLPPENLELVIAWTHRALALFVGALVLAGAILGLRTSSDWKIRAALTLGLSLYPVQIALGAVTATIGRPPFSSELHLTVGVIIFGAFLLSLAWLLEAESSDSTAVDSTETRASTQDSSPLKTDEITVDMEGYSGLVRAYVSLTKPRLMWLLVLVAAAGMAIAAGSDLTLRTAIVTLLGGVFAIGASGTFNHILERDADRKMHRTADRPLATDRVGVRNAAIFGFALAIGSLATFLTINVLAAVLGGVAIAYYSIVYTLILKPNTVQNTVIGGFAGSFPAVIGAAAATNTIGPAALLLAAVIFLWTPAHFYNLALAYKTDYERGGFPMMPVVKGEATTRRHILLYLGATFLAVVGLGAVSEVGIVYALTSVVVGGIFLWAVLALHRNPSRRTALRSFHASNAFLGALLVAIVVDILAV